MRSHSYSFILTLVFSLFLLCVNLEASQAQAPEPEGHLQLFFYATDGPSYFVVVEKKYQKLKLFEQKDSLKMLKEFTCARCRVHELSILEYHWHCQSVHEFEPRVLPRTLLALHLFSAGGHFDLRGQPPS